MNLVDLDTINKNSYIATTIIPINSCTCYVCGVCVACIVLPFFVGQFLGISLGLDLDATKGENA